MKRLSKPAMFAAFVAVFIGLPLMFYGMGDYPRRSVFKEALSLLTLVSLSLMLGQFWLTRANAVVASAFRAPDLQNLHKPIGYAAIGVMLFHPVLIVLPRAFEGGVRPWSAFVTLVTSFGNLGILLGIASWVLMLILGLTAWFRLPLMKRISNRYRGWRYLHGGVAAVFVALAIWHAIALGRHTDLTWTGFYLGLALLGGWPVVRLYRSALSKPSAKPSLHAEARS